MCRDDRGQACICWQVIPQAWSKVAHAYQRADRAKLSLRDLHDWRALTIELLSRIDLGSVANEEMQAFIQSQTDRIMDKVGLFAAPESHQEISQGLSQILLSAVQFSQLLRRQRACWQVLGAIMGTQSEKKNPDDLSHFAPFDRRCMKDDDEMDDDEDTQMEQKQVELFVAPGLFKRGNADGEGYDTQSCLVPILVLCRQ